MVEKEKNEQVKKPRSRKRKRRVPQKIRTFWNETWKEVKFIAETKGCDYFISNHGRVKSVHKKTGHENPLGGRIIDRGFSTLCVRLKGELSQTVFVHRFVIENFVSQPVGDKTFILHKDGNKLNNYWENLEWVTQRELYDFHVANGIYDNTFKSSRDRAILTEAKVRMMKKWIKEGTTKKKLIAKRMGISYTHLNRIERGIHWGHVTIDDEDEIDVKEFEKMKGTKAGTETKKVTKASKATTAKKSPKVTKASKATTEAKKSPKVKKATAKKVAKVAKTKASAPKVTKKVTKASKTTTGAKKVTKVAKTKASAPKVTKKVAKTRVQKATKAVKQSRGAKGK